MNLSEIESFHYKGSIELEREAQRFTVDIFYDSERKLVYQIIRKLNKWRVIAPGKPASMNYVESEWSDFD